MRLAIVACVDYEVAIVAVDTKRATRVPPRPGGPKSRVRCFVLNGGNLARPERFERPTPRFVVWRFNYPRT